MQAKSLEYPLNNINTKISVLINRYFFYFIGLVFLSIGKLTIRFIFYIILFVFLISCQDDKETKIEHSKQTNDNLKSIKRIYTDSLQILTFSGFKWKAINSKHSGIKTLPSSIDQKSTT